MKISNLSFWLLKFLQYKVPLCAHTLQGKWGYLVSKDGLKGKKPFWFGFKEIHMYSDVLWFVRLLIFGEFPFWWNDFILFDCRIDICLFTQTNNKQTKDWSRGQLRMLYRRRLRGIRNDVYLLCVLQKRIRF